MEYSQYIHFPCGNNTWCGKIFHALSWNVLPCHMGDLLCNQQWFIDSKHGFNYHSCRQYHHVKLWTQKKIQRCILSFQVQPMFQIFKALIQYLQYFQNYWNDEKLHAWKIFDDFQSINILVFRQTCVVVVRYCDIL
jgi:hypothetical protein